MVGGIPTPLKNTKVNRKDYPIYYGKYKKCSKPPTRYIFGDLCSAVFHIGALVRLCQMDKIHGVLVFRYNSYIYYYLLAVTAISKSRFKLRGVQSSSNMPTGKSWKSTASVVFPALSSMTPIYNGFPPSVP